MRLKAQDVELLKIIRLAIRLICGILFAKRNFLLADFCLFSFFLLFSVVNLVRASWMASLILLIHLEKFRDEILPHNSLMRLQKLKAFLCLNLKFFKRNFNHINILKLLFAHKQETKLDLSARKKS